MLYHITLRHKPADCPGRNPEKARASRVHFAGREARQRELGYQIRAFVGAWPSISSTPLSKPRIWLRLTVGHAHFPIMTSLRYPRSGWMAELIADSENPLPVTSDDADSQQTNPMQFHLTMEHNSQYCPAQNSDLIRALHERYDQREQRSKETGVRVQFFVSGEPTILPTRF